MAAVARGLAVAAEVTHRPAALFGTTLAFAAVLMFVLEPMAAKILLPSAGGAPAVWNTCVVFFQTMLLAGYTYAHLGPRWLGIRRHASLHVAIVLLSLVMLPSITGLRDAPIESHPTMWLLGALVSGVGVPFFVLTTSTPLVQAWFASTRDRAARDPYFLYAASNFGSLAGLLAYPLVIEPLLTLDAQSKFWGAGYVIFAGLIVVCGVVLWHSVAPDAESARDALPTIAAVEDVPGLGRRLRWVALSFAPSSLMLAVTTYISTDLAAIPLLWVVPLALYLLTFVVAFSQRGWYPRGAVERGLPVLILLLTLFVLFGVSGPLFVAVPVHLATFFLAALTCHVQLAEDRPGTSHLTEFYLLVAVGGVLGSAFNTFVAPSLFTGVAEYPAVLVLVCVLRQIPTSNHAVLPTWNWAGPVLITLAIAGLLVSEAQFDSLAIQFGLLAFPALMALSLSRTRLPFAAAVAGVLAASALQPDPFGRLLYADRTFFGIYRVYEDSLGRFRTLMHGTTVHGIQSVTDPQQPLSYYHQDGPLGDVFRLVPAAGSSPRIAVVGLGVGSLAAYRAPGQAWTFLEIDPAVETIARNSAYFSYLEHCGAGCRVVIGDARQSLTRDSQQYGLILLDAFSSDAIPLHLVTREALGVYLSRLDPGGVLGFHISNRHLDLEPVLAKLAEEAGLVAFIRRDRTGQSADSGKRSADWMMMAKAAKDLGSLASTGQWRRSEVPPLARLWTDDYSNILALLVRR